MDLMTNNRRLDHLIDPYFDRAYHVNDMLSMIQNPSNDWRSKSTVDLERRKYLKTLQNHKGICYL